MKNIFRFVILFMLVGNVISCEENTEKSNIINNNLSDNKKIDTIIHACDTLAYDLTSFSNEEDITITLYPKHSELCKIISASSKERTLQYVPQENYFGIDSISIQIIKNTDEITTILFFIVVVSCEIEDICTDNCFETDSSIADVEGLIGKWKFVGYHNTVDQIKCCKPEAMREMQIEFTNSLNPQREYNYLFKAYSSCNGIMGYYSFNDSDSISFNNVTITMAYCYDSTVRKWEEIYFRSISNAVKYNIHGDRLTIEAKTNNNLIFRKENELF